MPASLPATRPETRPETRAEAAHPAPDHGPGALYVYALMPPGCRPQIAALPVGAAPDATPEPVAALALGAATVLASPAPGALTRSRRNLLAHARLVEAAMAHGPVLPVRFGTVAEGAARLAAVLDAAAGAVKAEFARLSGRVEVGLRLSWDRDAALARIAMRHPELAARGAALAGQGAAAYQARIDLGRAVAQTLEAERAAARVRLRAVLAAHVEAIADRPLQEDVEVLRADLLLRAEDEPALSAALEAALAAEDPAIAARYVGPGPCWTFCRLALDLGHAAEGRSWG